MDQETAPRHAPQGPRRAYIVIHAHHVNVYDDAEDYVRAKNRAHVIPQHRFATVMDLVNWCRETDHVIIHEANLALDEAR